MESNPTPTITLLLVWENGDRDICPVPWQTLMGEIRSAREQVRSGRVSLAEFTVTVGQGEV